MLIFELLLTFLKNCSMKKLFLLLLVFIPFLAISQTTITGKVTSADDGSLLPGVSVVVKGTNIATITNIQGEYTLKGVPNNATTLVFSFMGMETKEVKITGKIVNCAMTKSNEELSCIVITALGAKRRRIFKSKNSRNNQNNYYSPPDNIEDNYNTEEYDNIVENEYKGVLNNPLSTFSIDVDNASYSNVRRFLNNYQLPQKDAVRIEEMINYFDYDYPNPKGKTPFSVITEISDAPWNPSHKLIHIGIQGKKLNYEDLKPSNLVFLIDVSGSMSAQNKLPLVKKSMELLLDGLSGKDRVAIVVYAGAAGLILPSTPANEKDKIMKAIMNLNAGGSTAGGEGIKLAYKVAKENFIKGGNNRVILATDGDFNTGISSTGAMLDLITKYRTKNDIYLTICGFGMGNYKDGRMEQISDAGNGNYFYIDNEAEAKKVFVKDLRANLFTIAKDVKIQIEFNPAYVKAYRLIGYEDRVLNNEDFNDDKKDAGELGAGHTVTALYEIIPAGSKEKVKGVDELKYQKTDISDDAKKSGEIMTLKLRYKPIHSDKSILIEKPVYAKDIEKLDKSSDNFRFSAAVAAFGMLLRKSKFITETDFNYDDVIKLAKNSFNKNDEYKAEFVKLVKRAEFLVEDKED